MGDMAQGPGYNYVQNLSYNMALNCRLPQNQILNILLKIGFFEERYGNKDMIVSKIVELANDGCSLERIFAAIKLLPGAADSKKAIEIDDGVVESAKRVLKGENPKYDTKLPDLNTRAVDL